MPTRNKNMYLESGSRISEVKSGIRWCAVVDAELTQGVYLVSAVAVAYLLLAEFIRELGPIYQNPLYRAPGALQQYIMYDTSVPDNIQIDVHKLRSKLELLNKERVISNEELLGPVRDDTAVLVVQVRADILRLQHLVLSLAQVRHIETTLVIFSHDYYDDLINRLIKSIDFCKVMQIYFPHSLQSHPHKFPGFDSPDLNSSSSECCQFRDARLIEKKQHWWWTANFVFERLEWSVGLLGAVVFLEEDNYVVPDFIYMIRYLQKSYSYFSHVDVVSFGKPYIQGSRHDLLILEPWCPHFHVGLAFNATFWKKIKSHSEEYCMYNDYNWNYSLLNLFKSLSAGHANMIACSTPRVISTRQFEKANLLKNVNEFLYKYDWFPEKVKAVFVFGPKGRVEAPRRAPPRGAGGWGDLRDQVLCLDVLAAAAASTEEQRYYDANYGPKSDNNTMN